MDALDDIDLTKLSDRDLDALESGDFDALSPQGKELILGPREFSVKKMLGNIPGDASAYGSEIVGAVVHPQDTFETLYNEVVKNKGKNIWEGIKNQYGSIDNALVSLEQKPVHTLADAASILYPLGGASKLLGAAKLGKGATTLAGVIDPTSNAIRLAKGAGKVGAKILPSDTGARLFKSATKIYDPKIANMFISEGVNPLSAKHVDNLFKRRADIGSAIGDIVDANNSPVPASGLFRNTIDRFNNLDDPSISAGSEGIGYQNWMKNFSRHVGYEPNLINDRPLRKFLGYPDQLPTSPIIGPNGQGLPAAAASMAGKDPNIDLKSIWEMRIGADKKHFTPKGKLKDPVVGPASGRMAAERLVSGNARDIIHSELANTDYSPIAKQYAKADIMTNAAEEAFNKNARIDDPFKFHSLMPVAGGYAAGYALGGHPGGTVGALGALGLGTLLNPRRKANLGIAIDKYRNMPIADVMKGNFPITSSLSDALSALQEEYNYQYGKRIRGR